MHGIGITLLSGENVYLYSTDGDLNLRTCDETHEVARATGGGVACMARDFRCP